MCGRYSRSYTWREVHAFSRDIANQTPIENPDPAFNVAPTQSGRVIASDSDGEARPPLMRLHPALRATEFDPALMCCSAYAATASSFPHAALLVLISAAACAYLVDALLARTENVGRFRRPVPSTRGLPPTDSIFQLR